MRTGLVLMALLCFGAPVVAEELDVSKATCSTYMSGITAQKVSTLFGWLAAEQSPSGVLDYDKVNKNGEELHRLCHANPSMGLKEAAQKAFKN